MGQEAWLQEMEDKLKEAKKESEKTYISAIEESKPFIDTTG